MTMGDFDRFLRDLFEQKAEEAGRPPTEAPPSVIRRIRRRQVTAAFTAVAVVAVLAVGSVAGVRSLVSSPSQPADHPTPGPVVGRPGGSIVVGTSLFPPCLNPLTFCAASTGAWSTVLQQVLPR